MTDSILRPDNLDGFRQAITEAAKRKARVTLSGGCSKIRVAENADTTVLSTTKLTGIVDHQASDFTITALAGTPVHEVTERLRTAGQHLPFDPTLADRGATIGGLVAAGLNGPCRLRYGGIRDFLIGCQFIDGLGTVVRSGGKVVKNAAGFDMPKFLIGSAGRFGLLTEVTFKVFPRPRHFQSLHFECDKLGEAVSLVDKLTRVLDFEAIEINGNHSVTVRMSGDSQAVLDSCVTRVREFLPHVFREIGGDQETRLWNELANHQCVADSERLIKVPLVLSQITAFDDQCKAFSAQRRYSVAGNMALLRLESNDLIEPIDEMLRNRKMAGEVILASSDSPTLLGHGGSLPFLQRVKRAVDPENVFGDILGSMTKATT